VSIHIKTWYRNVIVILVQSIMLSTGRRELVPLPDTEPETSKSTDDDIESILDIISNRNRGLLPLVDTEAETLKNIDYADGSIPVVIIRQPIIETRNIGCLTISGVLPSIKRLVSISEVNIAGLRPLPPLVPIPAENTADLCLRRPRLVPTPDVIDPECDAANTVGWVEPPFRVCSNTRSVIKSNLDLCKFLSSIDHTQHFQGVDNETDGDRLGTIYWYEQGKKMGVSFSGMLYLILSTEIDNSPTYTSDAKQTIETEFGAVAKFPEMLEKLAEKLLHGAKLARIAGIDKVPAFDAET
jgi:hypothetical protein